jgi:hypothetical protein
MRAHHPDHPESGALRAAGEPVFSQWSQGGHTIRKNQCWAAAGPVPGPQRQEPVHDFTTPAFWKEQGFREVIETGPQKGFRTDHSAFPKGNAFHGRISPGASIPSRLPATKIRKKEKFIRRDIKAFTKGHVHADVDRILLRLDGWLHHNGLKIIDLIRRKDLNSSQLDKFHTGTLNHDSNRMRRHSLLIGSDNRRDDTISPHELQGILQRMSIRMSLAEVSFKFPSHSESYSVICSGESIGKRYGH